MAVEFDRQLFTINRRVQFFQTLNCSNSYFRGSQPLRNKNSHGSVELFGKLYFISQLTNEHQGKLGRDAFENQE